MTIYVITGPPAAGKTTYVREHAKPGDITIDYDTIANVLTPAGPGSHEHTPEVQRVTKAARQAAIDAALTLAGTVDVYVIDCTPSPALMKRYRAHGAEIITIDPGIDVCLERAKTQRPWWVSGAIKAWYEEGRGGMPGSATTNPRKSHQWRRLAAQFKRDCEHRGDVCHLCKEPIDYAAKPQTPSAFEADHLKPVDTHPHLAYIVSNLRASHSSCNRSRGTKAAQSDGWVTPDW